MARAFVESITHIVGDEMRKKEQSVSKKTRKMDQCDLKESALDDGEKKIVVLGNKW